MHRRDMLKSGLAFGAAGLAGCVTPAAQTNVRASVAVTGDALVQPFDAPLAPIKSSMDRVTRTIVGLRPFRRPGPRLEAVKVGAKDVVHNYGHGGGGVSISWGVAEMAAGMAKSYARTDIAVLGSGSIGLSTALDLQRAGADVTVYAAEFPPYTTSNVAGAMWHPVTMFRRGEVLPETEAMLHTASRIAFSRFIRYANDPRYGVTWIRQFALRDSELNTSYIGGEDLYPGLVRNQTGVGPFKFPHWDAYYTLMIDSDIYMRALLSDFQSNGGRLVQRTFETASDIETLKEDTIVNCMGLGAGKVFEDETIAPLRGQLSFLLPQNDIDYGYVAGGTEYGLLYSFPRKTGILLGGSGDMNDWDLEPRQDEVERMVEGHAMLANRLT
ncbi:MAG: FAD-dependent oxidoreductase [Pseudomonadota bacterium]